MDDLIPPDIREFIIRHIDSVSQLEALLLLRANPGENWDLAKTASRVYAIEQEVAEMLERFCAEGFVERNETFYRYACKDLAADEVVGRLAALHANHLIAVTNMIHAKPRSIRKFADAFKLRKDS